MVVESISSCKDSIERKNKLSVLDSLVAKPEFKDYILDLFPLLMQSFEALPRPSVSYARGLSSILDTMQETSELSDSLIRFHTKLDSLIVTNGSTSNLTRSEIVNHRLRQEALNSIESTREQVGFSTLNMSA
jgi:hypothetical protein